MQKNKNTGAILLALFAAVFYAVNIPLSKMALAHMGSTMMASFLYIGACVGVGVMYLFHYPKEDKSERLQKADWPWMACTLTLDLIAPILLMGGIAIGTAANASLLNNFEIVATTLIALFVFREKVTGKLWVAIGLITVASVVLSLEGEESFHFSLGSLLVLLATCCWGLENNCTRHLADKSTYQLVVLEGAVAGGGAFLIALILGEEIPEWPYILGAMLLGFVAFGLSIFLYIRAQRTLGAAKTSAYYAVSPFVGSFLAFVINGEPLTVSYFIGLALMTVGTVFVVLATLKKEN